MFSDCANVIDTIASKVAEANPKQEGDYIDEEGLLCCGRCHGRKQFRFNERIFAMGCECAGLSDEEYKEELRKREERRKLVEEENKKIQEEREKNPWYIIPASKEKADMRKSRCFSHENMYSWTFENDNGKQPKIRIARKYADNWQAMRNDNIGLLFLGPVGTGKTFAACCIANYLCERDISAKVLNLSEAINDLCNSQEKNEYIKKLTDYGLLVIDDLGAERTSEYASEQAFNIIDNRIRSGKPLICTTNLSLEEMRTTTDQTKKRIYDRVLSVCQPVLLEGKSMREESAKEGAKILRSILAEE